MQKKKEEKDVVLRQPFRVAECTCAVHRGGYLWTVSKLCVSLDNVIGVRLG